MAERVAVDTRGIRLPAESDAVLDVLFDGRRIWSVDRTMRSSDEGGMIAWPSSLDPFLTGATRVTLRDHASHEVACEGELAFGSGGERVRVVDKSGRELALNKWGELVQPFDTAGAGAIDATLEQTAKVLDVLSSECGVPAFITYGTLLGAVREGKLIGHDDDVDVAYLSAHDHPADVVRESFGIERTLRRQKWVVKRFSGGFLQASFAGPDGVFRHVDIFSCFRVFDRFYQAFAVRAQLPREAILPLGKVALQGRLLPAPADPDALLEATYGPNWRVPDPSFEFNIPPKAQRRMKTWLGSYHAHVKYWEEFYRGQRSSAVPKEPSAFARWVGEREPAPQTLVEIGSGTGRDALWFARSGHRVLAFDYASAATEQGERAATAAGLTASFEVLDLYDLRQVMAAGARLAHDDGAKILYGRFLLHALEDRGREQLWRLAAMALRGGGRMYLEFRTGEDAEQPHVFGEHFRRFLSPDLVVDEIESAGGRVEHQEAGHGLAIYKDEDPHVCRLVAAWPR